MQVIHLTDQVIIRECHNLLLFCLVWVARQWIMAGSARI
jgi:hypothetical protein